MAQINIALSLSPGYSVPTRAVRRPRSAPVASGRTGDAAAFLMRCLYDKKWQQAQMEGRACPFLRWWLGYGLDDRGIAVRFRAGSDFSLLYRLWDQSSILSSESRLK
jgi:hypothetical protein